MVSSSDDDPMVDTGPSNKRKKAKSKVKIVGNPKKKLKPSPSPKKDVVKRTGFCISCQMPLELLHRWETPEIHAISCLDTDFSKLPNCPQEAECDNTIRNHYSKFNHGILALIRSSTTSTSQAALDQSSSEDLFNIGTSPKRQSQNLENIVEDKSPADSDQSIKFVEDNNDPNFTDDDDVLFDELTTKALTIDAVKDREGDIEIKVQVDPQVELETLVMKIPRSPNDNVNDQDQRIGVVGKVHKKKQGTLDAFFGLKPKENTEKPSAMTSTENSKTFRKTGKNFSEANEEQQSKRTCPFYKKMPGTSFAVDAFNYGKVPGITHYFLSHFHYDHYGGMTKRWNEPVICSEITSRLILLKIRMDQKYLTVIPMNQPKVIADVEVTLLDANHCPGSVMFLFKLKNGKTILHTGDFRACAKMEEYPELLNTTVDSLYLDTTYCKPEYDFPCQSSVISTSISVTKRHLLNYPKTLICVGSYTIGKERIFTALAEDIDAKIWGSTEKKRVLNCICNPIIESRLVPNGQDAQIHVVEMWKVKKKDALLEHLSKHSNFSSVIGIIPTGWTHEKGSDSSDLSAMKVKKVGPQVFQLSVPYSEHSSYGEMRRFVKFLRLDTSEKILATVNVGHPPTRNMQKKIFKEWVTESLQAKPNHIMKQSKLTF